MGKKRKYEDMDEEKLLRKITKLQDKLREKQNDKPPGKPKLFLHFYCNKYDRCESTILGFLRHSLTILKQNPITKCKRLNA